VTDLRQGDGESIRGSVRGHSGRCLPLGSAATESVVPFLFALVTLTVVLVVSPGASDAGATSTSTVSCTNFTQQTKAGLVKVKGCSPSAGRGYANATGPSDVVGPWAGQAGGTLSWNGGATTTIGASTFTSTNSGSCPLTHGKNTSFNGASIESASVTGASTTGQGIPAVGDAVSGTFCFYLKYKDHYVYETATMEPGSVVGM
jgi:hypothetical protein